MPVTSGSTATSSDVSGAVEASARPHRTLNLLKYSTRQACRSRRKFYTPGDARRAVNSVRATLGYHR